MKIAVLGRTRMLFNTVLELVKSGHEIVLIGTSKESPEYNIRAKDFMLLANELNAKFFCSSNLNDEGILNLIRATKADIAISVNWVNIIGSNVRGIFPYGILNAHAGDLPRFRGNAPANWAIIKGEKKIVMTIHKMDNSLDSGEIFCKKTFPIHEYTTIGDIYNYFEEYLPIMFVQTLEGIKKNTIVPEKQPENSEVSLRCYPRMPSDSFIDWNLPSETVVRLIRASSEPFCGAYTYYNGKKMVLWRAYSKEHEFPSLVIPGQVLYRDNNSGEVGIASGSGVVVIQEAQIYNEERKKPSMLISTTRARLGVMVEDKIYDIERRLEKIEMLLKKLSYDEIANKT